MRTYELWSVKSGNLVVVHETPQALMEGLANMAERNGVDYIRGLGLIVEDDEPDWERVQAELIATQERLREAKEAAEYEHELAGNAIAENNQTHKRLREAEANEKAAVDAHDAARRDFQRAEARIAQLERDRATLVAALTVLAGREADSRADWMAMQEQGRAALAAVADTTKEPERG